MMKPALDLSITTVDGQDQTIPLFAERTLLEKVLVFSPTIAGSLIAKLVGDILRAKEAAGEDEDFELIEAERALDVVSDKLATLIDEGLIVAVREGVGVRIPARHITRISVGSPSHDFDPWCYFPTNDDSEYVDGSESQ